MDVLLPNTHLFDYRAASNDGKAEMRQQRHQTHFIFSHSCFANANFRITVGNGRRF